MFSARMWHNIAMLNVPLGEVPWMILDMQVLLDASGMIHYVDLDWGKYMSGPEDISNTNLWLKMTLHSSIVR